MFTNAHHSRGRALFALAMTAALGGCADIPIIASPPHFDQKTIDGLNTVKKETHSLLGNLQRPAPDCLYANNTIGFDALVADIASVKAQANTVARNMHTVAGIGDLADSAEHFRGAASAGATTCLPANIVKNQQSAMDRAIDRLVAYEQKKPKVT